MKISRFNIFFEYRGRKYISNTLSKSVIMLDDYSYKVLSSKDNSRLSDLHSSFDSLKENGIIVDDSLDELGALRIAYQNSKNSTKEMEFVVAPTMDCNFECSYCFETKRKGIMAKEIQSKVIEFIKTMVNQKKPEKIRFVWFGGEPLLYPKVVIDMSKTINEFLQGKHIELDMIVITNGFCLNRKILEDLVDNGINHFQITIDGCKDIHDQRRMLKGGGGTYERIIKNLQFFDGIKATVTIRVNIDKENIGQFGIVQSEIERIGNKNIACHPALVEPAEIHDNDRKNLCYRNDAHEFYNNADIYNHYSKLDVDDIGIQLCYCGAEHKYSYAIDELGNIYKCWNNMGFDKEVISTVYNPKDINENIASLYLGRDPFTEDDCKDCAYIPICGGGCIEQKKINGQNSCAAYRYLYEQVIKRSIDRRGKG